MGRIFCSEIIVANFFKWKIGLELAHTITPTTLPTTTCGTDLGTLGMVGPGRGGGDIHIFLNVKNVILTNYLLYGNTKIVVTT